ncbi:MAG TPA: sigma 54-interacting transcriptional regulator [Syntrophales bacterium]|nr:sigma 54-interacting transcriptional regulator [Syntrophales bacterium]HPQ45676.1 sigma 54-interacting transcriptional regulator [Syntrophales bacterium]
MPEQNEFIEEILLNQDLPFKALLDSAYFAILAIDKDGYLIYINDIARSLLDFETELRPFSTYYPDIDTTSWGDFKKIIDTGEPQVAVPVMGKTCALLVNRTPVVWNGELVGVMSVFHKKEEYEKISQHLSRYQEIVREVEAIIASSYDGIYVTDGEANTIRVNRAYEDITGIKASEVLGRNMCDLVNEGFFSESVTLKVLEEKKTVTLSQKLKTGKRVLVTGNPFFDDEGMIKMVVTNVRDMTDLDRLNQQLEEYLEMTRAYKDKLQELQLSTYKDNEIIKVSRSMRSVYDLMERVCRTDATILFYGETGVGKDRIAEEVHVKSNRSEKGIFVKINCGAIPETLLESELFGYERGAFTGANKEGKPGLFEVADKGTLFLDEVESMSLSLQGKLLRVLQDFEITRVGGTTPRKVDVRLICASNQDLKDLVSQKKFRLDLYYRLHVIPVHIPPLRERIDDIPHLITLFLNRFNKQYAKQTVFSNEAVDQLVKYTWPGNVRELANLIERLVVITPGNRIDANDLPAEIYKVPEQATLCQGKTLREYLLCMEISVIQDAINKYGNARRAAPHLGVDPSTLTRKLKKHDDAI